MSGGAVCKSEAAPGDTFPISKQLPLSYQLDSLDLKNNKSDVDKSRPRKRLGVTYEPGRAIRPPTSGLSEENHPLGKEPGTGDE